MNKIIFTTLLFLGVSQLIAQTVYGIVLDEKGEPMIGATIKAGIEGVVTDIDGQYIIKLTKGNNKIECRFAGYESQIKTIEIKGNESVKLDFQLVISQNILDQLTVTSGRYEKPLGEVTVSMEILKPDIIERNNTQTVDDVLKKVPGVSIIGGQPNIRGGSGFSYGAGSRVLILVDDIPALQADAGMPNWNDFQVETIEQIEVVKGAASALYGSSALNGVVNIRTAYAKDKPLTTFSTFYNAFGDPRDSAQIWYDKRPYEAGFSATHRRKINKLDLVLGTNWRVSQSYNQSTYDSLGRITIGTRYRIRENLYVGFNSNINFGKSKYFFYWLDGDKGVFRPTPSTITTSQKVRYTIDPFVSYFDKKGNKHKLLGRFYSIKNNVSGGNQNQSDLLYGEYQFQRAWKNGFVTTAGLVTGGTFVSAELYGNSKYRSFNVAPYLQVEKKIGKLNLSGGMRYERNAVYSPDTIKYSKTSKLYDYIPNGFVREAKPVFRLGANYQLATFTFIRSSFGQGYRFPTIAEKFVSTQASTTLFVIPNGKLRSETGWSSEIGIKQGLKIGNWNGFLDVAAFWTEYKDMMEFSFTKYGAFQSQNVGNTRIKGIDATIAGLGKIGNINIGLLTGYTYIDPRFKDFDNPIQSISIKNGLSVDYNVLKYRFRHTFKFDAELSYKVFSLGYSINYNSNMEAIDKVFEENIPGVKDFRAANNTGVNVMDIRASYTFLKYYKLSFLLKNFTNEMYTLRPAQMESPRNVNVRLDVKF